MKRLRATYDAKCLDLALLFLEDTPLSENERRHHADVLAQDIQVAIENYLRDLEEARDE
jgi:hypothetical protein